MKYAAAKDQFARHLAQNAQSFSSLRPLAGFEAMIDFYRSVRAADCDIQNGGDTLLFQWGTYDWGKGHHFNFDITRQFIGASGEDEDIWQLSLTFRFPPTTSLRELAAGHRWCHGLDELPVFHAFVTTSPAYVTVAARADISPELVFQCAG